MVEEPDTGNLDIWKYPWSLGVPTERSLTYKRDHEDSEEDPKGVTEDVHEDDGDQGDAKIALALSSLTLSSTQNLETKKVVR